MLITSTATKRKKVAAEVGIASSQQTQQPRKSYDTMEPGSSAPCRELSMFGSIQPSLGKHDTGLQEVPWLPYQSLPSCAV